MKARLHDQFVNEIYFGDCMELLKQIPDGVVSLVVTSPPYNIGKEYEKRNPLRKYLEEQERTITECYRVLKQSGSMFWQIGSYVNNGVHIPLDVKLFPIFEELGMIPRNRIVWIRTHGLHASNRFSCRHETLLWFTKSDEYVFNLDPIRVPQQYPEKKAYRGDKKGEFTCDPIGKNPGDVWFFRNVKHNHEEQTIHPCSFPEDLIERVILAVTKKGDIVLDPYMGVGTVAVVARELGRNFIGAEINKEYHKVALHRLSGEPDENGNFPNLKTLRNYCEAHEIEDPSRFSFSKQVGKIPSLKSKSKIFPEHVHLERFLEVSSEESERSAFRRGMVDSDGKLIKPRQKRQPVEKKQMKLFVIDEA
ncbi:site-specific DNA-methyltransferase [bacterium]|nr:site-specific DNA-methyltransferase [bacterium]